MVALFPDAEQIAEMKCASQRFPVYKVRYKDVELAMYMSGVGAPLCTGNQEEIYALGVECLVLFHLKLLSSFLFHYNIPFP